MRRNHNQQQTDQADEIEVVQMIGLVEQEDVAEADEKQRCRQSVAEPDRNQKRQHPQGGEVPIHSIAGQRMDPLEAEIFEEELRFDVVPRNPVVLNVPNHLPQHDGAERDAEKDQRSNVNRAAEQAAGRAGRLRRGISPGTDEPPHSTGPRCRNELIRLLGMPLHAAVQLIRRCHGWPTSMSVSL